MFSRQQADVARLGKIARPANGAGGKIDRQKMTSAS
jgi:hypothetical protein